MRYRIGSRTRRTHLHRRVSHIESLSRQRDCGRCRVVWLCPPDNDQRPGGNLATAASCFCRRTPTAGGYRTQVNRSNQDRQHRNWRSNRPIAHLRSNRNEYPYRSDPAGNSSRIPRPAGSVCFRIFDPCASPWATSRLTLLIGDEWRQAKAMDAGRSAHPPIQPARRGIAHDTQRCHGARGYQAGAQGPNGAAGGIWRASPGLAGARPDGT
jgi:hypothetical protein